MSETTTQRPPDNSAVVLQSRPMCVQCMGTGYVSEGQSYYSCTYCHGAGEWRYKVNYDSDSYARRTRTARLGNYI